MMNHVAMQHARCWKGDVVTDHRPVARLVAQPTPIAERRVNEIEVCCLTTMADSFVNALPGESTCTSADNEGFVVVLVEWVLCGDVGPVLEDDVNNRAIAQRALAICSLPARVIVPQQRRELLAEGLMGTDVEYPRACASHVHKELEGAVRCGWRGPRRVRGELSLIHSNQGVVNETAVEMNPWSSLWDSVRTGCS